MAKMTRLEAAKALLERNPDISPSTASETLKKRGYRNATPGYVSSLKTNLKYEKEGRTTSGKVKTRITKMDKMRDAFRKNPDLYPPDVANRLGASATQAYKARKEVRKTPRAGSPEERGTKRGGRILDKVSLKGIAAAKSLIDGMGGLEQAYQAVEAIDDMGGSARAKATLEAIALFTEK